MAPTTQSQIHVVPPLPYDYKALEPVIDEQTMHVHRDKHHQAYCTNLNTALEKHPELFAKPIDQLLRELESVPEDIRTAVRNNGGGFYHHSLFWTFMKPNGGGAPTGHIAQVIDQLGGFDAFKAKFNDVGLKHFGSGWVWLVRTPDRKFEIISTPNQDSPVSKGLYPVFCNDLWEHAYYLKYQNRRADYLQSWWNVVNWDEVNRRLG